MYNLNHATQICLLFILFFTSFRGGCSQAASQSHALTLTADKDTVVRFFYQPGDGTYLHVALLFRVVEEKDPRWNTVAVFDVGRTTYISISEMQQFVADLSLLPLSWDESTKVENLETYGNLYSYRGMGVKMLSSKGTAKATIVPQKICEDLAPLDAALRTPR